MKFLYAVSLLIVLASIAFARPVILWLLGPEYLASAKTLNILVWASVPGFLNNALLTLLLAAAQERAFIRMVTVCTIFNIVMNIALVPRYSFYASAVVTVATELLLLFQSGFLAKLHFGRLVVPDDGTKITVGFVACLGTLVLLRKWVPEAWAGAAVFAMIGTAVVVWQGASVFNLWNSERRAH